MGADEFILHSQHVVTPTGVREARVAVSEGRITTLDAPPDGDGVVELGERWLLPGLVDTHVHVNEPGRTEWEGFATATRAAAAGGVTTIVDMPLNSIPATTSLEALEAKRAAARGAVHVDCAFWGGVVPGNLDQLEPMAAAGVAGFKCFLVPSGVDEFPAVGVEDLRLAMPVLAALGLPLLVHAEWPDVIDRAPAPRDPRRYADYLGTRPKGAEREAIKRVIEGCAKTGCRVHIVHLSSSESVMEIVAARLRGFPITVETCPHYLTLCAEEIPDGATAFKCAPPIRERKNRDRLWIDLECSFIDFVASDHSPCPPELKGAESGDFMAAWGGIASLELGLPVMWTASAERKVPPPQLMKWMSEHPAELAGLGGRKGRIAPGYDADLVVWDPTATWTVDPAALHQRHPITPYAGREVTGRVIEVFLRGRRVFEEGRFSETPVGELLERAANNSPYSLILSDRIGTPEMDGAESAPELPPVSEPESETPLESAPELAPESAPESGPEPAPEAETESAPEPEVEAESMPEPEPTPDPETPIESEPASDLESAPATDMETASDSEPDFIPEAGDESVAAAGVDPPPAID